MSLDIFFVVSACVVGFVMAWGVGANDLANIMSTTLGSKAVTVKQAMVIAIVFEFAGAFFGSGHVTNTIRTGIIDIASVSPPEYIIYGMLSILLAGSVWMALASFIGMPVSITNAIVGGLVGFGSIVLGVDTIHWGTVKHIAISWVCSPLIAGLLAYLLFIFIRRRVLSRSEPVAASKKYVPVLLFAIGLVLAVMVILKGLAHFGVELDHFHKLLLEVVTALVVTGIGCLMIRRITLVENPLLHDQLVYVEKVFSVLMALTACAMVFAHGSNDVAIAVGPITAILGIVQHGYQLTADTPMPSWIVLLGAMGVVIGLITYGRKVIQTVGSGITALTPSRAFAATLAAASTVIFSTSFGIPVSATQTLVGAVLGVGLARGIGALNLHVIRNIFTSWIVTIPATAGISIIFFFLIKSLRKTIGNGPQAARAQDHSFSY